MEYMETRLNPTYHELFSWDLQSGEEDHYYFVVFALVTRNFDTVMDLEVLYTMITKVFCDIITIT